MRQFIDRRTSPLRAALALSLCLLALATQAQTASDTVTTATAEALAPAPTPQSPLELALLAGAGILVLTVIVFGMRYILRDQAARDGLTHKNRADYLDSRSHLNARGLPSNHRHL